MPSNLQIEDPTIGTDVSADFLLGEGAEVTVFVDSDGSDLAVPRRSQAGCGKFSERVFGRSYEFTGRTIAEDTAQVAIIRFASYSGGLSSELRTDIRYPIIKNMKFTLDRQGCADFEMTLNGLPEFPIITASKFEVRIGNSVKPNYTGCLEYTPDQGTRKAEYKLTGFGYRKQLKEWVTIPQIAGTIYPFGMYAGEIFDDIMQNIVVGNTYVKYNAAKIDLTAGIPIANDLDFASFDVARAFDSLASIANCYWGVDGEGEAYFVKKSNTPVKTWVIGDGMGRCDVVEDANTIRNDITVERTAGRGSGGNGYTIGGVYTDQTSVKKYGLRKFTQRVPGYFGDNEVDIIGNQILNYYKDPGYSVKMSRIRLRDENDILQIGAHRFILPLEQFQKMLLEDETAASWTKTGTGDLALSDDTTYFIQGAMSLKLSMNSALNDIITNTTTAKGRIEFVEVWIYSSIPGLIMQFGFGLSLWDENTAEVRAPAANRWFKWRWDVSAYNATEIRKVGFKILTSSAATIYIDGIMAHLIGQQHITSEFMRATYNIGGAIYADAEFGRLPDSISDYTAGLLQQTQENSIAMKVR